jgi:uncharacterized protein involved in exopolysaccharide biosynthesis
MEATSREHVAGSMADSPDVANNALVQNLRVGLVSAQGKLADAAARYGRNHPQYQSAQAEVNKLRAELNSAMSNVSKSVGNNATVLRQRESELRAAVAAQKTKVLELNRARDELGVLLKDLDSAQRAFDAASQRFSQTRIEAQSEQSEVSILNPAVAPVEPSAPRVLLNTLVSILLGTILGVGLAMLLELLNRPIRSSSDLKDMLGIPVLGTIEWKPARASGGGLRALMAPRRLLRLN